MTFVETAQAAAEDLSTLNTFSWANPAASELPHLITETPGPASRELLARIGRHSVLSLEITLHPVAFREGQGVALVDEDGNRYLDFTSGTAVTNLGHAHPLVAEAIARAAGQLDNVHTFPTAHKARALEALAEVVPPGLTLFNFFCGGSEAVEGAMRVARAIRGRDAFVGFPNDYHGRTSSAASVSAFAVSNAPREPGTFFAPPGCTDTCRNGLAECRPECVRPLAQALEQNLPAGPAAAVMELVQMRNGATAYAPGYVRQVAELVRAKGGVFIADEVATGFGRTGTWFASQHDGVVPDIMTMGKGLGNGFPVSAIAVKEEFRDALERSFPTTSLGGNPMACAVIPTIIDIMRREQIVEHCRALGEFALDRMREIKDHHPIVGRVGGRGGLLGFEIVKDRATMEPFIEAGQMAHIEGFKRGIAWATPNHILRLRPPIVMSMELMAKGLDLMEDAIAATEAHFGY